MFLFSVRRSLFYRAHIYWRKISAGAKIIAMLERKLSLAFLSCAVAFFCTSLVASPAGAQQKTNDSRPAAAQKKASEKKAKKKSPKKKSEPTLAPKPPSMAEEAEKSEPTMVPQPPWVSEGKEEPKPTILRKPAWMLEEAAESEPKIVDEPLPEPVEETPPEVPKPPEKPEPAPPEPKEPPPTVEDEVSREKRRQDRVIPGRFFVAPRGGAELLLGSWGGRTAGPLPVFYAGGVLGVMLSDGPLWYDVGVGAALAGSPIKKWPGISAAHNDNLLLRHLEFELVQNFNVRVAQSDVFFSLQWDLGVVWTLEPMFSTRMLGGITYLMGRNVALTAHLVGFRLIRDQHFVWQLNGAATHLMLSFRFG